MVTHQKFRSRLAWEWKYFSYNCSHCTKTCFEFMKCFFTLVNLIRTPNKTVLEWIRNEKRYSYSLVRHINTWGLTYWSWTKSQALFNCFIYRHDWMVIPPTTWIQKSFHCKWKWAYLIPSKATSFWRILDFIHRMKQNHQKKPLSIFYRQRLTQIIDLLICPTIELSRSQIMHNGFISIDTFVT